MDEDQCAVRGRGLARSHVIQGKGAPYELRQDVKGHSQEPQRSQAVAPPRRPGNGTRADLGSVRSGHGES